MLTPLPMWPDQLARRRVSAKALFTTTQAELHLQKKLAVAWSLSEGKKKDYLIMPDSISIENFKAIKDEPLSPDVEAGFIPPEETLMARIENNSTNKQSE
jgi:hypothetical protein